MMITEKKLMARLNDAKAYLMERFQRTPDLGIILGSGLGNLADQIQEKIIVDYKEIPHFPVSTVQGHSGKLIIGTLSSKYVMVLQGRFHYYEGYEMHEVTFPVRLMQMMGIKGLIVTNAAGGINTAYQPGDLVIIQDHINLMGSNPLIGSNITTQGERFPDLSEAYHREWREKAAKLMTEMQINVKQGTYAAVSGPSYETPAEVRYLRTIGADLVGMSTVPEVIVAKHGGMKVMGISCVTNMAAGILERPLNHAEVIETTQRIETLFVQYVQNLIGQLD